MCTAQVDVVLMSGDFGSLDAKEVRLTIENKMAGIKAISREAAKTVDGHWLVRHSHSLSAAGGIFRSTSSSTISRRRRCKIKSLFAIKHTLASSWEPLLDELLELLLAVGRLNDG